MAAALYNRGNAYQNQKQYDRAIEDYSQAIHLAPGYWEALNNRGIAYASAKQYDRAIEDYNQAILLEPNDPGALTIVVAHTRRRSSTIAQLSTTIRPFD